MDTIFESPTGLTLIRVENAAYVGTFFTSMISQLIFDIKKIHFNIKRPYLYKDNKIKFFLHQTKDHYTFTSSKPLYFFLDNTHKIFTTATTVITPLSKEIKRKKCSAAE